MALIAQANEATNAVAARFDALLAWIETTEGQGIGAADTETLITELTAMRDRQLSLASNPNDPFPVGPTPTPFP